jgi:hypothetical protein
VQQVASYKDKQLVLVHEMLHIYTGKNDADLADALGLEWGGGADEASRAISRFLGSDCKVTK